MTAPRALDAAADALLPPSILDANLAALRRADPSLADRIDATLLPTAWRAVTALDGSTTFRTSRADDADWFDQTAAPSVRARGLLREFRAGDRCVALASAGTGEEIRIILDQLSHQLALFVFEPDLTALRTVLARTPLADAIDRGSIRFLTDASPAEALRAVLLRCPGLRAPQVLLAVPTVPATRVEATRSAIESVGREIEGQRQARIAEIIATRSRGGAEPVQGSSIAFLSLAASNDVHAACREFAAAAGTAAACGAPIATAFLADGPDKGHPVAAAEFLSATCADLVIWTGPTPPPALRPPTIRARWHTSAAHLPDTLSRDHLHLAASPVLLEELQELDGEAEVIPFFWPAPRVDASRQTADPAVYLIGDLPDDSADACGIRQATHQMLWNEMRRIARDRWEDGAFQHPGRLLAAAEKSRGTRIAEPAIRRQFLRIVRHVLIPTCGLEMIRQSVERNRTRLNLVGRGWRRLGVHSLSVVADDLTLLGTLAVNTLPAAAVFSLAGDPFSPALLTALSAGWPVILHAPQGVGGLAGIGAEQVLSFGDEAGLRRCLRSMENDRPRRRTERVREYVQTAHSAGRRLADLRKRLSG